LLTNVVIYKSFFETLTIHIFVNIVLRNVDWFHAMFNIVFTLDTNSNRQN